MKLRKYILSASVLLLTACGQQHDAKVLVKNFMKENLKDATSLSSVNFGKLDSTKRINDSIITKMRAFTKESERYKNNIMYSAEPAGNTLMMLRVEYILNKDSCSDTYYLDKELTRVVALKTN